MTKVKNDTFVIRHKGDLKIDKALVATCAGNKRVKFDVIAGDCYVTENAFKAIEDFTDITISARNIVLCKNAFKACPNLNSVQIITNGKAVYIDQHCFGDCPSLRLVKILSERTTAVVYDDAFCPKKNGVNFVFLGKEVQIKNSNRAYRQSMSKHGPCLKGVFDNNGILFPNNNLTDRKYNDLTNASEFLEMLAEGIDVVQSNPLREELDYKFNPSMINRRKLKKAIDNPTESEVMIYYR